MKISGGLRMDASLQLPKSAEATALSASVGAWSFEDLEVAMRFDREVRARCYRVQKHC